MEKNIKLSEEAKKIIKENSIKKMDEIINNTDDCIERLKVWMKKNGHNIDT